MSKIQNAMSVDVEDYFQVSAFEKTISRDDWDRLPCRVEANTDRILALFDEKNVKATFFTLGWVADRYPQLVKRIVASGHELACHGYSHIRVTQQTPDEFREDVIRAKSLLEDLGGTAVNGYRAASYSIGASNLWALEVLEEIGFDYSSSIYPVKHDLYGMPEAPRFAFKPGKEDGLLEVPISTVKFGQKTMPCGGGGYFRFYPYQLSKWMIERVNKKEQQACIFYFHPWEIDPEQPRQKNISAKTRFRHYLNLERMEQRLTQLLDDFQWNTMEAVFLPANGHADS